MALSLATTSSDSRIGTTWRDLRAAHRTALIPYLTAGFPTIAASRDALRAIDGSSDIIEVGVPFSDPLADGPTIQASTFRALANGMSLPGTLELIAEAQIAAPVVLFTYLNPVLQYGVERLLRDATSIGIAGLLLTDLPAGADPRVERAVQQSELDLIRLIAPTSTPERIAAAMDGAQGFVYLIARLGVTGASTSLAADLAGSVARVRVATTLPIAVGFGVSTAAQATSVAALADGVVIGSALVDTLGRDGVAAAGQFMATMRMAVNAA
jgi:tryptophan synthase alpha chain